MTLDEIRKKINTIDFEILKLLNSRMEFALRTKKFKSDVADPKREDEVIDYIKRHSQGLIEPDFCQDLFREIIGESKRLQNVDVALMGFQGEHGSFSEVAAREFSPDHVLISCERVEEVFHGVETGLLQYGIVPVESTLGGAVTDVNEFLVSTHLQIIAEVKVPISYGLLTLPETDPREIRVVYSHRQVLSQCQQYLSRKKYEGRPFHDSAAAAKMLIQERPEASAVIAGPFCAAYYHLDMVEEGIADHENNITRYLILSRNGTEVEGGDKCSIIFVAEHKAGALFRILKDFADAEISLTRIESMPNRVNPGNYVFFLDFFGSLEDPRIREVLEEVERKTLMYKFMGCYTAAKEPQS